jgi:hypothetical protein
VDRQKLVTPRGLRGIVEVLGRGAHLLLSLLEQEDEFRDHDRLCATAEAYSYVAITRLTVKRLAGA